MNNFLHDLALAHQEYEGWYPSSYSFRNNNPGNLRGVGGAFTKFATYTEGFNALKYDLKAKILGAAPSVLRYIKGTGKLYEDLVMQEYVAIYAPSADKNNPIKYCNFLCYSARKYNIAPSTPLATLAKLVRGELDRVPDAQTQEASLAQRLIMAQNALRWASPERASMLLRLIARIKLALLRNY